MTSSCKNLPVWIPASHSHNLNTTMMYKNAMIPTRIDGGLSITPISRVEPVCQDYLYSCRGFLQNNILSASLRPRSLDRIATQRRFSPVPQSNTKCCPPGRITSWNHRSLPSAIIFQSHPQHHQRNLRTMAAHKFNILSRFKQRNCQKPRSSIRHIDSHPYARREMNVRWQSTRIPKQLVFLVRRRRLRQAHPRWDLHSMMNLRIWILWYRSTTRRWRVQVFLPQVMMESTSSWGSGNRFRRSQKLKLRWSATWVHVPHADPAEYL